MKKIFAIILTAILAVAVLASCTNTTTDENGADDGLTVGVIQYISHPSLDNCYAGVEQALTEKYGENITIERQIGSDSAADSDCATFAGQYAAKNVDMMIAIATPAASPAFAAGADAVITGVTNTFTHTAEEFKDIPALLITQRY